MHPVIEELGKAGVAINIVSAHGFWNQDWDDDAYDPLVSDVLDHLSVL